MPRSSRQKSRRSHKHGEARDRSASEDDGALKDRKPRVEESRVSEPEKRKSSSSLQPSKDKDPVVTSNGDLSGEHGRKRKDRAEDSAVAVVDDRWSGGAEDEHVGDKKPKAEGFEAVELKKAGRSKASGGESKSRSNQRQDGSGERIEEVGGKPKSEKDLSRRDSTGSQHKNVKEKDHNKDTKERDKDIKDSKERDREYIKDAKDKDKDKEYKDAKERDREYKDAKERSKDHPKDTKDRDRDRDHPKDAKERDATERDTMERDSKERDSKERVAKERDSKERVAKERDTKERDSKERDAKDRDVKERDTKDRDAKERDTKDRDAKERDTKDRDAKERDTKDRGDAKERDVKERDTKERDVKERDKDHHRDVKDRDRDYYKEDRDRDYYKDAKDRDRENYKDSKEREKDYSKDARERDRDHTKDTKERDKDHSKDTRERDRDYYKDARERDRDYSKDARERDRDRGTERDKRVQDTRHERTDDVVSRKQASKIKTSGEEHGSKKNIENSGGKAQEGVRNLEPEKELDKNIRRRDGSGDKGKYPGDGRDGDDRRLSSRDDHTRNSNHKDEKEGRYRDRYKEEVDRDQRDRDDRGRDERTSRDHNSSKSGNKHFRDENRLPEGHYKKSKIQDTDHDTCPYIDDHGTKLKDNRGIDLKPRGSKEVHEDVEKNASSTSKLDPHSDRVRLDYMHADKVDSSMGSSRRKSSPSSGNHTMRDQFRASSKQGGSSSRKASSEDKQRLNTATRGDNVSVPGVHERDSESRTLERRKPKEGVRLGEVEPTAPHYDKSRSDARHSSNSLVQKSPSTGSDRRFPDKIGARRSFDPNSSKHGRDFPNSKDRDRGFEKSMSNDFYRGEMFDSEPIPTSFNRTNHLSGSSPSHLPPPPSSGHGTGSPSVLGSYEDDNRNQLGDRKPNNRFRRSGEHGIGRGQGNSWKSPATWQSPVPNGFISLQHGPPHPGYHPGVQQFPSPLYGVRPSLELNHTGVYHMHEAADRFSNHVRPFGWHNPMDDCPPPLPVWDARNGGVFGDESHAYGRPEWEVNRQLMGNRGWEMTADMWKGQNGNMNMELPMPQDSEYSACSEAWTGQTGLQSRREKDPSDCLPTVSSEVKLSNDRSPAKDGIENFQKSLNEKTSELSKPTVSDATTGNEDIKIQLCCSYLSKIDISLDLTQPGLYQECKFLLGSRDKAGVYNNMIKKDSGQSTQGDPTVAVPSRNNILSSVFPLSEDTVFQRAMSLYKKHGNGRKVTSSPSSRPEDKGSLEVLESQKPAGEDIETISADSLMAELVMVADNQTSDDTPANVDSTSNFVEECTDNQTSDDMPANVDSTSNFVEECMPICPEGSDSDEAMDQQSDTPDAVNSVEGSQSCETIMAECRVNVSRIHLSPGSTH